MADELPEDLQRWTAKRRAALVLSIWSQPLGLDKWLTQGLGCHCSFGEDAMQQLLIVQKR